MKVLKMRMMDTCDLLNKIAEIKLKDDKKIIIFFQKDVAEDECHIIIPKCKCLKIEDGIYQLLFTYKQQTTTAIIDLCNHMITFTSIKENGDFDVNQGSFYLITKENELDSSCVTNADIAVDFWLRFFDQHDETAIDDYLEEPYLQHNPKVADGIEAFRNEFHDRFYTDMKECHTEIKRVVSRGDLVFIHNILKRNPQVKGHAAVDIFRVENGKIVEHWDVIQPMPETSKNDHPMF